MRTTTDREALLAAIIAQPDEDTPRLAYADLLDETGGDENAARAEFIRLQIASARGSVDQGLLKRQRTLLTRHGASWVGPGFSVHPAWDGYITDSYLLVKEASFNFRRGFVEEIATSPAKFGPLAKRLLVTHPIRAAHFFRRRTHRRTGWLQRALARPELGRFKAIQLSEAGVTDSDLEELTRCEHLGRLESLKLFLTYGLTESGIRRLASPALSGLRSLSACSMSAFGGNPIPALAGMAASPHLAGLKELDLEGNSLGDRGARTVAAFPWDLRRLVLNCNKIGSAGAAELALSPQRSGLLELDLSNNGIGDEGIAAVASSPVLAQLRVLDLSNTDLGDAGAAALAARPWPLDCLNLSSNRGIGKRAIAALRERYGERLRLDRSSWDS